ncbi:MAG TPA: DUF4920 domain-containing protein [Vicinamibacteria bacterium]|nr:DUF4920 domain-containing protein [Vicinamibacteria bacterium]
MISKHVFLGAALALGLSFPLAEAADGTKYGSGVALSSPTPVSSLLAKPEAYLGKTVRVDGVITAVCEKRGCWMQITDTDKAIRIKVEDGVIVFPLTAMGKRASAEGTLEAVHLSSEQAEAEAKRHAEEHKGEAKSEAPRAGTTYQIRGTGAVVY